jgi:hypothetical protein
MIFGFMTLTLVLGGWRQVEAQGATTYTSMAPLDHYLMERDAEISLARSAAPESISSNAEILVLTHRGYEAVAKGSNGFVCMVERSWTAGLNFRSFGIRKFVLQYASIQRARGRIFRSH